MTISGSCCCCTPSPIVPNLGAAPNAEGPTEIDSERGFTRKMMIAMHFMEIEWFN
jgi:hypothetical protein